MIHAPNVTDSRGPRRSGALGSLLCFMLAACVFVPLVAPTHVSVAAFPEDQSDEPVLPRVAQMANRLRYLARAGVEQWHSKGHRGRGVKVAILDSGFRGYRDHLGKSLPSKIVVKSFRGDGNLEAKASQHGILCGEVVHALAPEAELLFINWESDSSDRFLDAVRWAKEQGARVMTCSVIMPSWSDGEGGGTIHAALAQILGPGTGKDDVLFFASAGNIAKRHWSGVFSDKGDGFHEWKAGVTDNALLPWNEERVSVEVCWKDKANYDLFVYETEKGVEVARSVGGTGEDRRSAVVRFQPDRGKRYYFRIKGLANSKVAFHCVALHSALECYNTRGSICFPADGPSVIAVGAVDEKGRRMSYSSCGPNSICPKPDFVAAVPFPSLWRERPFAGTSAAAPQAAGIAAVLWSRHPSWQADKLRTALQSSAQDLGTPGHDVEFGYGLLRLPEVDGK